MISSMIRNAERRTAFIIAKRNSNEKIKPFT